MKKRTIKKQFWCTQEEAKDLEQKAKMTCLKEAALVRLLIRGYEPRERPDDRFYEAMKELSVFAERIEELAKQVEAYDKLTGHLLLVEAHHWREFQAEMESKFLRPEEVRIKWQ